MRILSLQTDLPSGASISIDGKVINAALEERFTREKNDTRFPKNAIVYCLNDAKLSISELDAVVLAGNSCGAARYLLTKKNKWSIKDYLKEQKDYWKPLIYDQEIINPDERYLEMFKHHYYEGCFGGWFKADGLREKMKTFQIDRPIAVAKELGIDKSKVKSIDHHTCHAYYSYISSPYIGKDVLCLTVDGMGDGINCSAMKISKDGKLEVLHKSPNCYIGRIYRYITLVLGMKPNEHEFKVMGLAPYGKAKYSEDALSIFRETLVVDGLDFKWKVKPTDCYEWFRQQLEAIRFDSIAYALQKWVEELLCEWTENWVKESGISTVVYSGGVAMNIKAMGAISSMDCIDEFFVGGSASDETMAISAGLIFNNQTEGIPPQRVKTLYLGEKAESKNCHEMLISNNLFFEKNSKVKKLADMLAENKIIGRCVDRMEFGQRALGNRSILANPANEKNRERINKAIKSRDFWMPFAPVVLDTYAEEYLINPKRLESPYMTLSFNTTKKGREALTAALHPSDGTARAQILRREDNPKLYELIEEFANITGVGALLNTSFNLHGYPIVRNAMDAIHVFTNSDLDVLLIDDLLIKKNQA